MAQGVSNEDFAAQGMDDEMRRGMPPLDQVMDDEADEGVPESTMLEGEDWDNLPPEARKVLREREDAKRELARRLEASEARLRAMEERINSAQSNGNGQPRDANDLSAFDDDTLYQWMDSYHSVHARAAAEPDNEEVQAAAAKMSPQHYARVQRHLITKAADERVGKLRGEWESRDQEKQRDSVLSQAMLNAHGVDGMLAIQQQQGPLYSRTQELLADAASKLPFVNGSKEAASVAAYFASLLAKSELSRGEGGDRGVRNARRLGLEAQTRRAPGPMAQGPSGRKTGPMSRQQQVQEVTDFLMQ